MRHEAYRKAGICDTWIIGNNRREKQEAFIEAILAAAHEVMFLDPQVTPPRIWLRWPVSRAIAQEWQNTTPGKPRQGYRPSLDGWVGRMGYGATLIGVLSDIHFDEQARLIHPVRANIEARTRLLQTMSAANLPDAELLYDYLQHMVDEETLRVVLVPLLHAYVRDPDLLRRYNYGRGQPDQPPTEQDIERIQKAQSWLKRLAQRGFPAARIQEALKEIPFVGPYAALAGYGEMLLAIG